MVFGGIVYSLIGLVPTLAAFWKFQLVMVLFNLTTASVVFLISVAFADISVGSLIGTLIMLFKSVFPNVIAMALLEVLMRVCFSLPVSFSQVF
jgi:hypothetical protein